MKFRKKPVVIDAEKVTQGAPTPAGVCFCDEMVPAEVPAGQETSAWMKSMGLRAHVHTLEGPLRVSEGDWIITGVKGEKYPCKSDIFAVTYEKVEEVPRV